MSQSEKKFKELYELITTLRGPDGCPWDQQQTPQTFKSYVIEEVHELLEAIDHGDPELIREELGDMFFQLLFLNQLYEEQGHFSVSEALQTICEKMIRRHPHVFGDEKVLSEADQRQKWNKIKANEKVEITRVADLLQHVPKSLPGLRRAQRVSERAAHNGFEWQDLAAALNKLEEEVRELKTALASRNESHIFEELGDAFLVLVNISRLTKISAEDALHASINKFIDRFSRMEDKLLAAQKKISALDYEELLEQWNKTKDPSPS